MMLTIFNEQFQLFAYSWTAGIFGAAAFASFGPLFERGIDALHQRFIRWREERRVRDLGTMSDDWQPRWPRRRA